VYKPYPNGIRLIHLTLCTIQGMTELTGKIYYSGKNILKIIESEFELVEQKNWYRLYRNTTNNSFWRLDEWDKYQIQFFVRLETKEDWTEFDDRNLRMGLLKRTRGLSNKKCVWKDCNKTALKEIVYCEYHAYNEIGLRK
jgi:hypothetical protein